MRIITTIEPKATGPIARKRVAAYARVSSGKDAMLQSLSAQISYNSFISGRGDWAFAGVYADEALTGTKDTRPEFQRLLADCRAGKIDMVIAKSITRFARNTVTLLETARELKLLGIDIFFEKENIHTMSGDGELMLTLLASFAQEESLSASENQKWRIRKSFEKGELANLRFIYGYDIHKGVITIDPIEATVVRTMFDDYISGMGFGQIAKKLRALHIPAPQGGLWNYERVAVILKNEKYTGNALLQKSFVADHLTKKRVKNTGQLPKYYAENTHPQIVDTETFKKVQEIIAQKSQKYAPAKPCQIPYPFTGVIRCGVCGKKYHRRHAAAGTKYEKIIWVCSTYDAYGKRACSSQQISDGILQAKTAEALGLSVFDEIAFKEQITEIHIPAPNRLVFVFTDGRTEEVHWQNPSRSYSWTPEMKQAARERELARIEGRRQK